METKIEVRVATADDLSDIARIHITSWQQTYVGQIPQAYLDGLSVEEKHKQWAEIFYKSNPADPNIHLAFMNGEAVGFISFGKCRHRDLPDAGEIYAVYLLQHSWGKGVGHALFETACRAFKKNGYSTIYLWVLSTNKPAITSYQKWGGTIVAALTKKDSIGNKPVSEIAIMFKIGLNQTTLHGDAI